MRIFGVMVVRNEADILAVNVRHHLSLGVDQMLIVDNGSGDGTTGVLEELSRDGRVRWTRWDGLFLQSEITTALAREAYLRGADWVLPIDADEFWWDPDGAFRSLLANTSAAVLRAQVVNFVQHRDQVEATPESLLQLVRRPPHQVGPLDRIRPLVEGREIGFVEAMYPPKCVSRASLALEIGQGNHFVGGADGSQEDTDQVVCLHAPLRSRAIFDLQVEHGGRVEALGLDPDRAWHVRRWWRLAQEQALDEEWRANSYCPDGYLEVHGSRHATVEDFRLRDLIAPWLSSDAAPPPSAELDAYVPSLALHEQAGAMWTTLAEPGDGIGLGASGDKQILLDRLERYERGMGAFDRARRRERAELQKRLGERDQTILDLQAELLAKVGERDDTIRSLQAELLAKVGERDETILGLQSELLAKVGERDQTILDLQAELHAKVAERDAIIRGLQAKRQAQASGVVSAP